MIIVSGCPRSGTSLMMDCLRLALGEDRIMGSKFPKENRGKEKLPFETDAEFDLRKYFEERLESEKKDKRKEKTLDMNPNGFWECRYTTQGISWHLGIDCPSEKICKVVSQGLIHTDPKYVDKVIYMLRDPREVAKSQENLVRRLPFNEEDLEKQGLKIHSPLMFVNVTYQAIQWIKSNPQVPVIFVHYDSLLENPEEELRKVGEFLGEGDFSKHPVEKRLYRSKPEEGIENDLWAIAEEIYAKTLTKDYDGLISFYKDNVRKIKKDTMTYHCFRKGRKVVYNECIACKKDEVARNNFKKDATKRKISWISEPCVFECGIDVDHDPITIKQSIENNFWLTDLEKRVLAIQK